MGNASGSYTAHLNESPVINRPAKLRRAERIQLSQIVFVSKTLVKIIRD
jgi:hypothetical protein